MVFNKKFKAFENIQFVYIFVDKHNLFQKLKAGYMFCDWFALKEVYSLC